MTNRQVLQYVMELAPHGDLFDDVSDNGPMDETTCATILRQLTLAVAYLHNSGVVHRDIKPENILLGKPRPEFDVKLTNFCLANTITDQQQMLVTSCGTPEYVAPEVLRAEQYSYSADCWSMGVVAFICRAGYPPFYGESTVRLAQPNSAH